jgi:hypothetical protein
MATARPVASVRRNASSTGRSDPAAEIRPARWAGVALVIAALMGTILLAVFSPGDVGKPEVAAEAEAPPVASPGQAPASHRPGDTRLPTTQPAITSPRDGSVEGEWDIAVMVSVPQDPLPSRALWLVILSDGQEVKRVAKPGRGKSVEVQGVPLEPGANLLTAALEGPGGLGPASAPVVVHQDRDAPELGVVSPENGTETYDDEVDVVISSEPGASLVVTNNATKRDNDYTVGPTGTQTVSVRLAVGKNRISVTSTDEADQKQDAAVMVVRKDDQPDIKLGGTRQVKRSALPACLRIVVDVKDAEGEAIPEATVTFTLGGPGWQTKESVDTTNGNGRAVWTPDLLPGASDGAPRVTVEVVTPQGGRGEKFQEIKIG